MPALNIIMNGDNAWPDLREKTFLIGEPVAVAFLDSGMASGKPSVAFRIELEDGRTVVAQTSAQLFSAAARALNVKYPNLHD